MAKVSVIVTTYNRKEYLTETINSILNQTFSDFELIVVDNFSGYDFFELIASFNDKRIRCFQNSNNGVIATNRNIGIKHARYEYLAFCDDDDLWMSNKLEKQVLFIENNNLETKSILLYTNCIEFSEKIFRTTKKSEISTINDLLIDNQVSLSSVLISRNELNYFFNENREYIAVEDYLLWCTLKIKGYEFYLLKDALIKYRILNNSMSNANYGMSHLRIIIAKMFVLINNKNLKINYLRLCINIMLNILKFWIKKKTSKYFY